MRRGWRYELLRSGSRRREEWESKIEGEFGRGKVDEGGDVPDRVPRKVSDVEAVVDHIWFLRVKVKLWKL